MSYGFVLFGSVGWCLQLSTQIVILEHEGNWSKALEYYELQLGSSAMVQMGGSSRALSGHMSTFENEMKMRKPCRGLVRSLQQIGCVHVLDMYCQGLTSRNGQFQHDVEFIELQVFSFLIYLFIFFGTFCWIIKTFFSFIFSLLIEMLIFSEFCWLCNLAVWGCMACWKLGLLPTLWRQHFSFRSTH